MEPKHPEWLPDGWNVVVEARNNGKKCKYYINNSNGKRLYSKPQVLQYLQSYEIIPERLNKTSAEAKEQELVDEKACRRASESRKSGSEVAMLAVDTTEPNHMEAENTSVKIMEGMKESDASFNNLIRDPCIDYAFKVLTGAIPLEVATKNATSAITAEDVKKVVDNPISSIASLVNQTSASSSILPCDDVMSDPCFENAIKLFLDEIAKGN